MITQAFDKVYDSFRDFIRNIFDTPVKPYMYKATPSFSKKFINYFIYDGCVFINRGGTSALIFKIPADQFFEFLNLVKLINYKTYLFLGFNWVVSYSDFGDKKTELYFWIVKQGSLTCWGVEDCFNKLCSYKDKYIYKLFEDTGVDGVVLDGNDLLSFLSKVSFFEKEKYYDGEYPLLNYVSIPDIILRDNLFYVPKREIYLTYSMKSYVGKNIDEILLRYPFGFDYDNFFFKTPMILNSCFVLYRSDERHFNISSFICFKLQEGYSFFRENYYKKDEFGYLDFSGLVKEFDYNVVDSLGDSGFVFQREQKNLAFLYHNFSLPFNMPYFEDISVVERFLSVEV